MDRASLPGYLRLALSNNSGQEVTTPLVAALPPSRRKLKSSKLNSPRH
jgi:hypothetical protein